MKVLEEKRKEKKKEKEKGKTNGIQVRNLNDRQLDSLMINQTLS